MKVRIVKSAADMVGEKYLFHIKTKSAWYAPWHSFGSVWAKDLHDARLKAITALEETSLEFNYVPEDDGRYENVNA